MDYFSDIAGRASTFCERRTGDFVFVEGAADADRVRDRLTLWRRVAASGDADRFQRRLSWDGLTEHDAERLVGAWRPKNGFLPDWTPILQSILNRYDARPVSPEAPAPSLEEFLAPVADEYWDRLTRRTSGLSLLTEAAITGLKKQFLDRVVFGVAPAFLRELSLRKAIGGGALEALFRRSGEEPSRRHYDALMDHLRGEGLREFLGDYPVLTRLICQSTDQAATAMAEYLSRLETDYDELARVFQFSGRPKVRSLVTGLSDPHDFERGVVLAFFENDIAIIYKPRVAGLWRRWDDVLAWVNERQPPLPFYRIRQICKGPHLWQEHVAALPCNNPDEVRRYYRRLGHLLAVLHVLRGGDMHNENIVAHGEFPVLVDVEMLLQGQKLHRQKASLLKAVHERYCETFCGSVLNTGLLPMWVDTGDGEEYDQGGAGGIDARGRRSVFKNAGTDDMTLELESCASEKHNVVRHNERIVDLLEGRDDLVLGLREMGRWLAERKNLWLALQGPLEQLAEEPVRFLLRNTENYSVVYRLMLEVDCLRDGADFSLRLESMADRWTQEENGEDIWPLFRKELESLERLDIPLFTALPTRRSGAGLGGKEIPVFEKHGYERARAVMENLTETEIDFQADIARKAINSHADMMAVDTTKYTWPPPLPTDRPVPADAFVREALQRAKLIAQDIQNKRLRMDGSTWWIEPSYDDRMRRMKLGVLDMALYNGATGVALFLAAYERVTGDGVFRPLAYEALEMSRPYLKNINSARQLVRELGVGGILGTGGLIYALTKCGEWLGDTALIEEALMLASALNADVVHRDKKGDIIGGSAGTLMALLALERVKPGGPALAAARSCGDRLLALRQPWKEEPLVWVDETYQAPITGFSHGTAGMSYALWKLFVATKDERYAQAARVGVDFENRLYDPSQKIWKESPDEGLNRRFGKWATWCHGSPGIGMGRLDMLDLGPDAKRDALRAIEALQTTPEHFCDHICCGNFGRLELFHLAGEKLRREDFFAAALSMASQLLADRKDIDFRFNPHLPPGPLSPSLFVGTAGIGYQLLRLAGTSAPSVTANALKDVPLKKLPSLLLLE